MPITESAITLEFPDENYFRFEDCDAYKELQHLREMDACWYDQANNTLYLIELKDWNNNQLVEESDSNISSNEIEEIKKNIYKYRIKNLVEKSIDSICMITSIILKKPQGNRIRACAPMNFNVDSATQVKLLSIINWTDTDESYISNINTAYRSRFKAYARLFDIKAYMVLTRQKAVELFDWVT